MTAAILAKQKMSETEWETRCNLAALYRIFHRLRMTDFIYTHLSARVPGEDGHFLINRYGEMFDEITASSLVKMDLDGNVVGDPGNYNRAGFTIHSGCYMARPDANCVVHLHTRASIAVAALKCGLLPISQHSLKVLGTLGYHDYEGPATDLEERESLGRDAQGHDALILRNHGLLILGKTIQEAFSRSYFLEVACQIQVEALAGGQPPTIVPEDVQEHTKAMWEDRFRSGTAGEREWPTLLRSLERDGADYRK